MNNSICLLPPRAGYVERVNTETGEHYYAPTPETEEKLRKEAELEETLSNIAEMTAENLEAICMLEILGDY